VILQPITKSPTIIIATKRDNHRVSPPNKLSEDNEISSASSLGYPGRRGWVTELEKYGNLSNGPEASAS